jgi:hypothetical protein
MIKSFYRKRKIINGLFLEMELELDLGIDLGQSIAIENITYKVVTQNKEKILLEVHDTETYRIWIRGKSCRFFDENISDMGEGLYVENTRELYRFLRKFEYDLSYRLSETVGAIIKPMSTECKEIVQRVLENI